MNNEDILLEHGDLIKKVFREFREDFSQEDSIKKTLESFRKSHGVELENSEIRDILINTVKLTREPMKIRLSNEDMRVVGATSGYGKPIIVIVTASIYYTMTGITKISFEYNDRRFKATADSRYEGNNFALCD